MKEAPRDSQLGLYAVMALSGTSWSGFLVVGGAGFGEDVQADVAAHLGPFVVLFGEDGADEADEGAAPAPQFASPRLRRYWPVTSGETLRSWQLPGQLGYYET